MPIYILRNIIVIHLYYHDATMKSYVGFHISTINITYVVISLYYDYAMIKSYAGFHTNTAKLAILCIYVTHQCYNKLYLYTWLLFNLQD